MKRRSNLRRLCVIPQGLFGENLPFLSPIPTHLFSRTCVEHVNTFPSSHFIYGPPFTIPILIIPRFSMSSNLYCKHFIYFEQIHTIPLHWYAFFLARCEHLNLNPRHYHLPIYSMHVQSKYPFYCLKKALKTRKIFFIFITISIRVDKYP